MKRVVILGKNWPEAGTTAAGVRMMQLLHFFCKHAECVFFGSAAAKSPQSVNLQRLGIETKMIVLNSDRFDTWIEEIQPDMVVFDRFTTEEQYGWRVSRAAADAQLVLNTEDLHSLREAREEAVNGSLDFSPELWRKHRTTAREVGSLLRCDLNLLVSEFEQEWIQKEIPGLQAYCEVVPFMYPLLQAEKLVEMPGFEERHGFVFVGNGKHRPNQDGVRWFIQHLWPFIREQIPEATFSVAGAYWNSQWTQQFKKVKGVEFKGQVDPLSSFLSTYRINVLPLRYGAGIKGKLAEGMRAGCVSITTSQGIEGLKTPIDFPGMIKDQAADFVSEAVRFHQDQAQWEHMQGRIPAFFNANWSEEQGEEQLLKRLQELDANYRTHRQNNVLQRTILHHRLRSTEYLSRYIALKNQKQ